MRFTKASTGNESSSKIERWISDMRAYEIQWRFPVNDASSITLWFRHPSQQLVMKYAGLADLPGGQRLLLRLLHELRDQPESSLPQVLQKYLSESAINADTHILVVEDHEGCRRALGYMLEHAGYLVHAYSCAEAAWDDSLNIQMHAAILDWRLPGMCGGVLAKELRRRIPHIPILFWTAEDHLEARLNILPDAVVVSKGSSTRALLAVLRRSFRMAK